MAARRASVALALLWLAAAALPGGPAPVSAATYWSIALSPMTLTEGVPTNVTVTVTAGNDHLGCVALNVPAGFAVVGTGVSSVPANALPSITVSPPKSSASDFHHHSDDHEHGLSP